MSFMACSHVFVMGAVMLIRSQLYMPKTGLIDEDDSVTP